MKLTVPVAKLNFKRTNFKSTINRLACNKAIMDQDVPFETLLDKDSTERRRTK